MDKIMFEQFIEKLQDPKKSYITLETTPKHDANFIPVIDTIEKLDIVDKIDGLTPAIAIDQKTTGKNPRSTVGTITEIYDYLRLLYARIGIQYCYKCDKPISQMSSSDIIEQILNLPQNSKIIILAPLVNRKKGTFADLFESLRVKGYVRAMVDGVMIRLDEEIKFGKSKILMILLQKKQKIFQLQII